jgi:Rrf2 family protein
MFSKACEYGIKASLFIAMNTGRGRRVNLEEIARGIESPLSFTSKILQKLVKSRIIDSVKGPAGGFEIKSRKTDGIKISEIVSAIDGKGIFEGCGLGFAQCNEKRPCPLHHKFKSVRNDLKAMLESATLKQLSEEINTGNSFLTTK